MDAVKTLPIQAAFILRHRRVVAVRFAGQSMEDTTTAGPVSLNIGHVIDIKQNGMTVTADGKTERPRGLVGRRLKLCHTLVQRLTDPLGSKGLRI